MAPNKIATNLIYINQQIAALLRSTSNTVKCIWFIVFISYSLSFFEEAVDIISVTPGYFMPPSFRIWTAFTFCFLETHIWSVCIDIIMIGLCGKVIEPLWGPYEIISFFSIVNVGVALSSSASYLLVYMFTSNPDLLFDIHIHGLLGFIGGITVAVKQIMPDIMLVKTPLVRIANKNMPLLTIFVTIILWVIGLSPSSNIVMVTYGVYVSWIYLRFYQRRSKDNAGDLSDSFNFVSFFPSAVQPVAGVLADITFNIFVKLKLCRRRVRLNDTSDELTSVTVNLLGQNSQDEERRKQKALKALSEHLNKTNRPRIVGNVTLQKAKSQSPKKSPDSANENIMVSDFITRNESVQKAQNEQTISEA